MHAPFSNYIPWSGTKRRICPFLTHCLMPLRVLLFTPATSAVSSTMQLKIFFWAGRVATVACAPCWDVGRWRERIFAESVGEFCEAHEFLNAAKL
jgi:hypothetical protein